MSRLLVSEFLSLVGRKPLRRLTLGPAMGRIRACIAVALLGCLMVPGLAAQAGANPYGVDQGLYQGLLGEWIAPPQDPAEGSTPEAIAGLLLLDANPDLRFSISRDETGWMDLIFSDGTIYRILALSVFDQACLRLDLSWTEDAIGAPDKKGPVLLILFLDERHALMGDGSELDSGYFVEPDLPVLRLQGPGLP